MSARALSLAVMTGAFVLAAPGAAIAFGGVDDDSSKVYAVRRTDELDEVTLEGDDLDDEPNTSSGTDGTWSAVAGTRTSDRDGDGTRGNDGTTNGNTITRNRDGDDTRGNDGTGAGDGGTRTSDRDGDGTRGNDGTTNGNSITWNRDGDDTRGNDGTSDGDWTVGEDGTGGGNNTN